jgi:hypothetical protein
MTYTAESLILPTRLTPHCGATEPRAVVDVKSRLHSLTGYDCTSSSRPRSKSGRLVASGTDLDQGLVGVEFVDVSWRFPKGNAAWMEKRPFSSVCRIPDPTKISIYGSGPTETPTPS